MGRHLTALADCLVHINPVPRLLLILWPFVDDRPEANEVDAREDVVARVPPLL